MQTNMNSSTVILETDPDYKEKLLNSLMSKFKFTSLAPIERIKKVCNQIFLFFSNSKINHSIKAKSI